MSEDPAHNWKAANGGKRQLGKHLGFLDPILTFDDQRDEFKEKARKVVLDALDALADEVTASRENGPKDRELKALFAGVDPIAERLFAKMKGI